MQRLPLSLAVLTALLVASPALGAIVRPNLGPLTQSRESSNRHFKIHYTIEVTNENAVSPTDTDQDGIPDYVNRVAKGLEDGWKIMIDQDGWRKPYIDNGEGGDEKIDVYIANTTSFGFAYPEPESCPPATMDCANGMPAYLQIKNNLNETLYPPPFLESLGVRLVTHLSQLAYFKFRPSDYWWLEATAEWVQMEKYSLDVQAPEAYSFLIKKRMESPWNSLHFRTGAINDPHFFFVKYIVESRNDDTIIRRFFVDVHDDPAAIQRTTYEFLNEMLSSNGGGNIVEDFQNFSTWMYLSCFYDDDKHFKNGALCRTLDGSVKLSESHSLFPAILEPAVYQVAVAVEPTDDDDDDTAPTFTMEDRIAPIHAMGAQYYELILGDFEGSLSITVNPEPPAEGGNNIPYGITVIEDVNNGCAQPVTHYQVDGGGEHTLIHALPGPTERVILILQNLHRPTTVSPNREFLFTVDVSTLSEAGTPVDWDARSYEVPIGARSYVEVVAPTENLLVGETRRFAAVSRNNDCTSDLSTESASWSSSAPAVAEVANSGAVTGVSIGTADITATIGPSVSEPVTITVGNVPVGDDDDDDSTANDDDDSAANDDDDGGGDSSSSESCSCETPGTRPSMSVALGLVLHAVVLAWRRRLERP